MPDGHNDWVNDVLKEMFAEDLLDTLSDCEFCQSGGYDYHFWSFGAEFRCCDDCQKRLGPKNKSVKFIENDRF